MYEKQTWVDGTSIVDDDKLNHIEDGIYDNAFESGSNTNGNYIKFNDGTLLCMKSITIEDIYSNDYASYTWTFPIEFVNTTIFCFSQLKDISQSSASNFTDLKETFGATSKTSAIITAYNGSNGTIDAALYSVFAIGKWK